MFRTSYSQGRSGTVTTRLSDLFKVRPEEISRALTRRSKALILSYPNNPTGAIMSREDLEELADVVVENDLMVVSDEVYGKLTYSGRHVSFAQLEGMQDRTIALNGLSKSHAMTGWRVGFALGNSALVSAMTKIHQYTMCARRSCSGGSSRSPAEGRGRNACYEARVRSAPQAVRLRAEPNRPGLFRAPGSLLRFPVS